MKSQYQCIIKVSVVSNGIDFILLGPPEKYRDCLQGWEAEAFYSWAPIPHWSRVTRESVNFLTPGCVCSSGYPSIGEGLGRQCKMWQYVLVVEYKRHEVT